MSKFTGIAGTRFAGSRISEAMVEVGLTAAAAGFTAAVWLSIGAWVLGPERPAEAAVASQPGDVKRITLPTVYVVGRRDSLEGTPLATTAQNTAANPVTLRQ